MRNKPRHQGRYEKNYGSNRKMIVACTMLYNRLDLLEIWLNELKDVVDKFVVVESTTSFSGTRKPLYFNKALFPELPIEYVVVDNCPTRSGEKYDANIENYITENVFRGLTECKDDDIIFFSHGDEIPRKSSMLEAIFLVSKKFKENPELEFVCRLKLFQCRCYLNGILGIQKGFNEWGPFLISYKSLKKSSFGKLKHVYNGQSSILIGGAGWHYSWLGPKERILEKLNDMSDQTYLEKKFFDLNYIQQAMYTNGDILDEAKKVENWPSLVWYSPYDKNSCRYMFPEYVLSNLEKFKHLIKVD